MVELTAAERSAEGRAASAAVCARRSFEAATICMALVIFCVALVEAMRTRMSLSEAILYLTPTIRSSIRSLRRPATSKNGRGKPGLVGFFVFVLVLLSFF